MRYTETFFYLRKFIPSFRKRIIGYLFEKVGGESRFEVPSPEELKELSGRGGTVVFISHRSSLLEQFFLNGFFLRHGIDLPSHSFGPKTLMLFPLRELFSLLGKILKGKKPTYNTPIRSLYLPLDQRFFSDRKPLEEFFSGCLRRGDIFAVPLTTLWNKDVTSRQQSRRRWLLPFIGKYNLWATFGELVMFVLGKRKLTIRIGISAKIDREIHPQHLYEKLYRILQEEKKNVVGAARRNWLEMKNETLLELSLKDEFEQKLAKKYLNRIYTRYRPSDSDRISTVVNKVLNSIFSRIDYPHEKIKRLRHFASMRNINLVFIPTHKSYFDYLLLSNLLYREQVTVPLVVSGDNLNFFPLGYILRTVGAFFVKRKIGDNLLYKKVFKAYLRKIVESGYDVEFFIEGGRSRNGRVRNPRTGILSMLSEIKRETRRRIYIVPVSITYEKLKEIDAYQQERNSGKEPERKGFLKKFLSLFRVNYGPVYINFNTPIYLSGKFNAHFPREIAYRLESESVVSFSAIFATIFLTHKTVGAGTLVQRMNFLVDTISQIGQVETAPALKNSEKNAQNLIEKMIESGKIERVGRERYRLRGKAHHEFNFHKNAISFAVAPILLETLVRENWEISLFTDFLESSVKGFRRESIAVFNDKELPPWIGLMAKRFFHPLFLSLHHLLETVLKENDSVRSRSDLIRMADKKALPSICSDDLWETLIFLEEKGILGENLSVSEKEVRKMLEEVDTLIEELRR